MDTFLRTIEEAPECRNDKILVALVKMQLVADAAQRGNWNVEESTTTIHHDSPTDTGQLQAPPVILMKMLHDKLKRIGQEVEADIFSERTSLSFHLQELGPVVLTPGLLQPW